MILFTKIIKVTLILKKGITIKYGGYVHDCSSFF